MKLFQLGSEFTSTSKFVKLDRNRNPNKFEVQITSLSHFTGRIIFFGDNVQFCKRGINEYGGKYSTSDKKPFICLTAPAILVNVCSLLIPSMIILNFFSGQMICFL